MQKWYYILRKARKMRPPHYLTFLLYIQTEHGGWRRTKKRGELNHLGHETHASSFWREPRFISNVGLFGIFGFLFFHFIFDTNSILIAANGVSLPVFHSKEWGHARPAAHTVICSMLYLQQNRHSKKKNQKINMRRQEGAAAHNVQSACMLRHYISRTQKTMRMRICMLLFGC